ncbi:hypothetical protein WMY93_025806 [Mugilogobius chulae]|uniref:Myotubularin phosphatase domain-containing protein n=1 Tax=Mugilogobius chulae TaxID=88201 RepID=A0AAW0MZY4_9GOBI
MKQFLSNRSRDPHMNWFESAQDWEQELERCGAVGWRVSAVNERFEMATSLPRFVVVPQRVLDTELKKSFAHFSEGRIPRWSWRHPRGADLLRMSSFQNNIYHEKDDVRNLELILFGGHSSLCVVVELGEELPSPLDILLAHSRLRTLCLGDVSSSLSVPDDKWLSTLESTHWLHYTRLCLRKASEVCCLLRSGHLTVALQEADDRDMGCLVSSLVQLMCDPHTRSQMGFQGLVQKEWVTGGHRFCSRFNYHRDSDKDESPLFLLFLDCVWQLWTQFPSRFQLTEDFLLALHDSVHLPLFSTFLANSQRERLKRTQHLGQSYTRVEGWQDVTLDPGEGCDPPLPPVWDWDLQYSKERQATFTQPVASCALVPPLLNGNLNTGPDALRITDTIPGSVFLLSRGSFSCHHTCHPGAAATAQACTGRATGGRCPQSTCQGLWTLMNHCCPCSWAPAWPVEAVLPAWGHSCTGLLPPSGFLQRHPVERLAQEVQQLRTRLAQVSLPKESLSPETQKSLGQRHIHRNLNQNANNSTFLFAASTNQHRSNTTPAKACTNQSSSSQPSIPAHRSTIHKHTFLFRASSPAESRTKEQPKAHSSRTRQPAPLESHQRKGKPPSPLSLPKQQAPSPLSLPRAGACSLLWNPTLSPSLPTFFSSIFSEV